MKKTTIIFTSTLLAFLLVGCNSGDPGGGYPPVTPSVSSIAVTKMPNKTEYSLNEAFDSTGLEITATYRNGTSAVVTDYTLSTFDSSTVGSKIIDVTYKFKSTSFTVNVVPAPIYPTAISIGSSYTIKPGNSKSLSVSYTPATANAGLGVTWSSSNPLFSVSSSGVVTANSSVEDGDTATITATSTYNANIKATATFTATVTPEPTTEWTILFYICGSDLESGSGRYATADIKELLSIRNQQPDSVKIVVETGGAKSWGMSNVNKDKLGHFIIDKNSTSTQMTFIENINKANMGEASTLENFLKWGITNYPAKKYGLFMWNHGGAMDGCCFDENYDHDSLSDYEVYTAVKNAREYFSMTEKFEFIAYDACLMAVQDIAELNSYNFNYMLASQESEYAGGYDYDTSFPTLYSDPENVSTKTFLQKIGADFMNEQEGEGNNDQTQSVLDLSKMAAYKTAWEDMASSLSSTITSSTKWNTLSNAINNAMKYGYDSDYSSYNGGYTYDIFDAKGALKYMKTAYSSDATLVAKIEATISALESVVVYNRCGSQMTSKNGSNGLCMFCPISGYNSDEGYYTTQTTNFSTWRTLCIDYGNWH